jgi:hypothetical protein
MKSFLSFPKMAGEVHSSLLFATSISAWTAISGKRLPRKLGNEAGGACAFPCLAFDLGSSIQAIEGFLDDCQTQPRPRFGQLFCICCPEEFRERLEDVISIREVTRRNTKIKIILDALCHFVDFGIEECISYTVRLTWHVLPE